MDVLHTVNDFMNGGVPSYVQTYHDIRWGVERCLEFCNATTSYSPVVFFDSLKQTAQFDASKDLPVIGALAVAWTVIRYVLTLLFFKPIASWCRLIGSSHEKYPESAWKFIVYSALWGYECYCIFGMPQNRHIFYSPDTIWKDNENYLTLDVEVYCLYVLQLSFYIHSIYATFFMDAWRKDSMLMIFHHFLTISLIGFSYATRYHKIGLLVLFCHDITDIMLEMTKCNVYFKTRGGKFHRFNELVSNAGFLGFALTWMIFRLYWLPLKVLHSTGYGSMKYFHPELRYYFFFNVLLWTLQLLNMYWFTFIVNFIIKVATGQMDEVDDIREDEVLEKAQARQMSADAKKKARKTD